MLVLAPAGDCSGSQVPGIRAGGRPSLARERLLCIECRSRFGQSAGQQIDTAEIADTIPSSVIRSPLASESVSAPRRSSAPIFNRQEFAIARAQVHSVREENRPQAPPPPSSTRPPRRRAGRQFAQADAGTPRGVAGSHTPERCAHFPSRESQIGEIGFRLVGAIRCTT